jgi:hypothetical protein
MMEANEECIPEKSIRLRASEADGVGERVIVYHFASETAANRKI